MAYETKDNTGSLFINEGANAENKQPQKTGTVKVNGKLMRIAVWETKSKDGTKTYESIKFSEFEKRDGNQSSTPAVEYEGDSIPF